MPLEPDTAAGLAAALDTATPAASFVVVDAAGHRLVGCHGIAIGRRSAGLLPTLLGELAAAGIETRQIRRWTVGMGPGSFTGIRLGAALVRGICAGTGAICRGLPSSLALAAAWSGDASPPPETLLAVLQDARRQEAILSLYRRLGPGWQPAAPPRVIPCADLTADLADGWVLLADDPVAALLPPSVRACAHLVPELDAAQLLAPPGWSWPGDRAAVDASFEPVYVRPAVFVPPLPVCDHPVVARLLGSDRATSPSPGSRP